MRSLNTVFGTEPAWPIAVPLKWSKQTFLFKLCKKLKYNFYHLKFCVPKIACLSGNTHCSDVLKNEGQLH